MYNLLIIYIYRTLINAESLLVIKKNEKDDNKRVLYHILCEDFFHLKRKKYKLGEIK